MSLYTEAELRNLPAGTKIYTQGRELTVHKVGTKYLHVKNEYDRNDQLYLTAKVFKTAEAMNAAIQLERDSRLALIKLRNLPWHIQLTREEIDQVNTLVNTISNRKLK